MHALGILGLDATVFVSDGATDNRLGADAGESEGQYRGDGARQETACDQALLHAAASVTGKAEQMPCVVHELVHV